MWVTAPTWLVKYKLGQVQALLFQLRDNWYYKHSLKEIAVCSFSIRHWSAMKWLHLFYNPKNPDDHNKIVKWNLQRCMNMKKMMLKLSILVLMDISCKRRDLVLTAAHVLQYRQAEMNRDSPSSHGEWTHKQTAHWQETERRNLNPPTGGGSWQTLTHCFTFKEEQRKNLAFMPVGFFSD